MKTTPRFFICLFANEIFGVKITIFIKKYNFGHKLHRSSVFTSCKTRNMMPDILQNPYKNPGCIVCKPENQGEGYPAKKGCVVRYDTAPRNVRVISSEIYGIKAIPY